MLGIVVPYWNPFGNRDRLDNLERCLARLRGVAGVRTLCVEMACGGESGLADIVLEGGDRAVYLWQKERLINHGCAVLAGEGIDRLGYVDSDCLFIDPDWPCAIDAQFEAGCNVVQGFTRVDGGANAALASYPELADRLHGGSMFLHRDLFRKIDGFYEYCIVGGGDFVLLMAVTGDHGAMKSVFPGEAYRRHAGRWLEAFRDVALRPACADNAVQILDHGNPQRSHRLRHALLQDFVPEEDIVQGEVLDLTERGRRLLPRLRAYCAHREDRADIILRR